MGDRPRLVKNTRIGDTARFRQWAHLAARSSGNPPNAHDAVELAWVESGEIRYRIGRREIVARPGDAMLVPAGVDHATGFGPHARAGAIWIDESAFEAIAEANGQRPRKIEPGLHPRARSVLALTSVLGAELATDGADVACEAIARAIAAILARSTPASAGPARSPRDPRVRMVLDRIHDAYFEPLVVEDLARLAGTDRFHLSRLFRDELGVPPYRYLLSHRIRRAAELLREGRHTVTEAAFDVGFNDLSRFARAFKNEIGVAPSEIARGARAGQNAAPDRVRTGAAPDSASRLR